VSTREKKNRPYLFIDGLNVFIRHYLVNQTVSSKSEPIGGVVGFLRFLNYAIDTFAPSKVFVVWETGGGSARRRKIYKEYKANRGKIKEFKKLKAGTASMRDTLVTDGETKVKQLSQLYKLLKHTPVCQVFVSGTECDDVLAYLVSQHFRSDSTDKIIVSNDKDFYQLLEDDSVTIYDHATRTVYDGDKIFEKYGIAPRNFCMARALVGDNSDNLHGVAGVGLKTVVKRFPQIADRSMDLNTGMIMEFCDKQVAAKARQKVFKQVRESEDIVKRNWKLMHLSSAMLSAKEIAKITHIAENHEPKMDKIALIKDVLASGMAIAFDFEKFTSEMRLLMTY